MNGSLHNQLKNTVDNAAGAGTANQAEGKVRETIGQGKQALGEAIGSERLEAEGSTDALKGKAQQVGGLLQEKAEELGEQAQHAWHETAENAKAEASKAMDNVKQALRDNNATTSPEP